MKRSIGCLMAGLVVVMAGSYTWTRRHHVVAAVAAQGDSVAPETFPHRNVAANLAPAHGR